MLYAVIMFVSVCLTLAAADKKSKQLREGISREVLFKETPKTVHKYTYTFMEGTLKSSIMWKCFEKERMFDSVALQCTGENQDNLSIIQHSTMLNLIVVTFLHSFSHKSLIVKIYFVTCALTSQC